MDYIAWSKLISKYYFRRGVNRVMLHITMQDLIDFAKEENVEIIPEKLATDCTDDDIKKDFVRQFWSTPFGNATIEYLQKKLLDIIDSSSCNKNYLAFLPIVALLIMPICENDDLELHGNDYYGHLLPFLYKHQLIIAPAKSFNLLAQIKLDKIWSGINQWALNNNIPFQADDVKAENGRKQYVRSLMKQSLLSPSILQKFCIIFDKAGLVPKTNIENDRLLSAFKNYYNCAGVSQQKFNQLTGKDFCDYLISVLREEYDHWDGTTRIKERDRSTGKIRIVSGNTSYPLLLQMDYEHRNSCSFAFRLYCSDIDNMDDMSFVEDTTKVQLPVIYIKNDGYASKPFPLNEEKEIYATIQNTYSIHEMADKSLRGCHIVTDYYLLCQYKNKYIATNEFIKGKFYFALIRHEAADDFSTWLTKNNAKLIKDDVLGGFYSVYKIEHASEELPNKSNLRFKSEVRCKSVNNLEVKTAADSSVVYLSNLLPAQFEITGVDISKDKIYAVSVNDPHRNSIELTYDHDKNLWILKVFTNRFQIQKEFVLYHNEKPIPYCKTYKFADFEMPSEFKEICLNQWGEWGELNEPTLSKGLELPDSVIGKELINGDTLGLQMENANPVPIQTGRYLERDYLLYAITSASYQTSRWIITMPWLKEIRDRLFSEFGDKESRPAADKYSLSNALADYFRMGYVNYAYTESELKITANRPTLILLTPKYKREVNPGVGDGKIVLFNCTENNFKCLLTGGRTIALVREIEKHQQSLGYQIEYLEPTDYLQPQTIFIHAASRSVFKALAEKCHLFYQDNIYANSLIKALPSVEDYITIRSTKGKERNLFGVKSFRAIDYNKVGAIYPNKLASKQAIANYEIDKSEFDSQSDVVTFFPGSRDEITVSMDNGHMVEIDKYWGYFIGMYKAQAKILHYDEDTVQISMPQQFRLPLLYARALTLLNGSTPKSAFGSRTYDLDVNPFTSESKPANILQKLGQ